MSEVEATLDLLRAEGLFRQRPVLQTAQGPRRTINGQSVLVLCSNDYLGLAADPALRRAAAQAAELWGAGAGASPHVCGHTALHGQLEEELATFKGSQACVLFGSGFLANMGVIAALAQRGDVVFSDALNHASIVDGCRLAQAETVVYAHGDLDSLADGLRRARSRSRRALVVTDAVFSMDGDRAPLQGIVELARRHGASVVADEAHATGVIGSRGRGLVAELGLEREVDVVIGTLGKALGSYGAFVCCDVEVASLLVNRARTMIFSTALPPPSVGAAAEAVRLLRDDPDLMRRLHSNARVLRDELIVQGFAVDPGAMPIVPLLVGRPDDAMRFSDAALRRGIFAQAIRPPTVPEGSSRLRVVATAAHTEAQMRHAARTLAAVSRELFGKPRALARATDGPG